LILDDAVTIPKSGRDDVTAYELDNACVAYDAVPCNEPVILGAINEFRAASEPDVITFFQLGILYSLYCG
jgi:hypothetical protein